MTLHGLSCHYCCKRNQTPIKFSSNPIIISYTFNSYTCYRNRILYFQVVPYDVKKFQWFECQRLYTADIPTTLMKTFDGKSRSLEDTIIIITDTSMYRDS